QAEDGIRDGHVTGVQTCALPISYSIIHLFLHDYDDAKILSFCAGLPFFYVMTEQDVWNANKKAILSYVPGNKDLKLIWERDPQTDRKSTRLNSSHVAISYAVFCF